MIWPWERASAESARPSRAEATHVAAISANNSTVALGSTTAPWVGAPLPQITITTKIAD